MIRKMLAWLFQTETAEQAQRGFSGWFLAGALVVGTVTVVSVDLAVMIAEQPTDFSVPHPVLTLVALALLAFLVGFGCVRAIDHFSKIPMHVVIIGLRKRPWPLFLAGLGVTLVGIVAAILCSPLIGLVFSSGSWPSPPLFAAAVFAPVVAFCVSVNLAVRLLAWWVRPA